MTRIIEGLKFALAAYRAYMGSTTMGAFHYAIGTWHRAQRKGVQA